MHRHHPHPGSDRQLGQHGHAADHPGPRAVPRRPESLGIGGDEIGITVDGVAGGKGPRALVLATTLDRLVLGYAPVLEQWRGTDPFHRGRPSAAWACLRHSRQLLFGGKNRDPAGPALRSHSAGRIELRLDVPFTIDGEFFQAAPGSPVVITAAEEVRYVKLRP